MKTSNDNTAPVRVARVVQVTDCHLGPDTDYSLANVRTYHSFMEVLSHIVNADIRPDLVMVSGDVAANGNAKAYQLFIDAMEQSGLPYAWLPGNHDDFSTMQDNLRSGHYWPTLDMGAWRLYSLNTAVPGEVGGYLAEDELRFLVNSLDQEPDSPTAIFMHHPPVDIGCAWLDRQQVSNGDVLLQLLNNHPQVKLVFTGHVHQEVEKDINGIQLYSTPSTCFQFLSNNDDFALSSKPPGYRWIDFYTDGTYATEVVDIVDTREKVDVSLRGY